MDISDGGTNGSRDSPLLERQYGAETPASVAVIGAVATLEDTDPIEFATEFGVTLNDWLDPKALDQLVGTGDGLGTVAVEFLALDYRVRVDDAGRVRVFARE